jgi:hypothetical protein
MTEGHATTRDARGSRVQDIVYVVAVLLVFALAGQGLFRKITRYLAIDQYGYLTFSGDLAEGRVFHTWPPLEMLEKAIPFEKVDALSQTYIHTRDRMYCRYTPGFPIVLATWMRLFGPDAAHYLDPILFLFLLAVWLALAYRLLSPAPGARWLALAGTLLLLLLPSYLHLWAITILRDVLAQLLALLALLLALPRRVPMSRVRAAAIGFLFGYLVTTRIDSGLYILPLAGLFLMQPRRPGAIAVAALLATLGVSPLLAYNYAATGNPLRPTQGMEMDSFFHTPAAPAKDVSGRWSFPRPAHAQAAPDVVAEGETAVAPQSGRARQQRRGVPGGRRRTLPPVHGGGLRLSNLPKTLPGNLQYVRGAFGNVILQMAAIGAAAALFLNRSLLMVTVPYSLAALLFFSFWAHADPRYIAGLLLLAPLLAVGGIGTICSVWSTGWLARRGRERTRAGLALGLAVALAILWRAELGAAWLDAAVAWSEGWKGSALPVVSGIVAVVVIAGVLAGGVARVASTSLWTGAALASLLLATSLTRVVHTLDRGAVPFQGAQGRHDVVRARANIEAVIEPGAVVLTTSEIGRPAENIDHYTHAHAIYLRDLERWGLPIPRAASVLASHGPLYLFLPSGSPAGATAVAALRERFEIEPVLRVPAHEAPRYFVASRFGTTDMELSRVRLPAEIRAWLRERETVQAERDAASPAPNPP